MDNETPDDGGSIIDPKFIVPNFAYLNPLNVVVHGLRVYDPEAKAFKYHPALSLFLNNDREKPHIVNVLITETFDDSQLMARNIVIWANTCFGNVSRKVAIFDKETEENIDNYNVTDILEMESAILELDEIKRTDIRVIQ